MLNGLILNLYNFSEYDQDWTDIPPIRNYPIEINGPYIISA